MESKTVIVFVLLIAISAGVVVAVGSIPVTASNGQRTIICTANLDVSGTYNDLVISHTVTNFALAGGGTGCHSKTLLDLVPSSQFNLFPVGLSFSVTLTAADGTTHGPYNVIVKIPVGGAAPSFPFSTESSVAGVPQGIYAATVDCPVQCNSGTTYTTTVNI